MAACTSDPMEEQPGENGAPEIAPAHKIVNTSVSAEQGTLLVYFDDEAVGQVENMAAIAAKTRAAVTRSGLVKVDEVLSALDVTSLRRVFPYNAKNEARARAAASTNGMLSVSTPKPTSTRLPGNWPPFPRWSTYSSTPVSCWPTVINPPRCVRVRL